MSRFLVWLAAASVAAPVAVLAQTPPPSPAPPAKGDGKPEGNTVQGVVVNGESGGTRTSIDRRSYDLTRDLQTSTGSLADALRNVPSVEVDMNGAVSLRGERNVTIMIDGKPTNQFKGAGGGQALQAFPADQIERVEVMTNPSAAFSPEGVGGVINLITKKARKAGRSGSVRANMGTAGRRNGGGTFAYNSNKVSLSADAGFRHDPQHSRTEDVRTAIDPVTGAARTTHHDFNVKGPLDQWNTRLGLDYDLDPKTRLSAELRHSDVTFDFNSDEPFVVTGPSGAVAQSVRQSGVFRQSRDTTSGSLGLRRKFADDHQLDINLSQERTLQKDGERLTSVFSVPFGPDLYRDILQRNDLRQGELKVDYSRPMPRGGTLTTGWDLRINDNRYDVATLRGTFPGDARPDAGSSDLFGYKQTLDAVYATHEQPIGDLTVQAGVRLEKERLDLDQAATGLRARRDTRHAFPTLHLAYRLSDTQQLTGSYSERIKRPEPDDLNPFRLIEGFTANQGNPNLQPQITHSFETGWQRKDNGTVYLATLYYRRNENGVTDVVSDLGNGVLLTTKENLARSRNAGLELVASGKLVKTLSYNLSTNLYWTQIDASDLGLTGIAPRRSSFAAGGRANLNWQATPNDLIQVNAQLTPKRLLPQGYSKPMLLTFLGYRHKFSDNLSGVITAQDPIDRYRFIQVIDSPALYERIVSRGRLQAAYVGLTWSFGAATKRPQSFDFGAR